MNQKLPARERSEQTDEMWQLWLDAAPRIYERIYYKSNPVIAHISFSGHRLIERDFDSATHFGRVLEVGAGTGQHLRFVRHGFDEYVATDVNPDLLAIGREHAGSRPGLRFELADATRLPYEDASFDRVISVYNLEHLPFPHDVLKEWRRVVRPGGVISIAIPAEGGIAWNMGRYFTTRRSFAREGLNLDYIIAREHINACYRLVALIRHYFPNRQEYWYPLKVPVTHVNLVYAVTIRLPATAAERPHS